MEIQTTEGGPPAVKDDEKMFALIAHLSPLFVCAFIAPVAVMLIKGDSQFVKYHAIQALVYQAIGVVFAIVINAVTCGFGSPLALLIIVGSVWVGIQAYGGSWNGYPMIDGIGRPPAKA